MRFFIEAATPRLSWTVEPRLGAGATSDLRSFWRLACSFAVWAQTLKGELCRYGAVAGAAYPGRLATVCMIDMMAIYWLDQLRYWAE